MASFRKRCVDFHWHFHPEIELVHILKGRGVRYVGQSVEPFADGDFCLLGSNLPHAFGSHPADRKGAEWTVAHFLPSKWGATFWELPEARRIRSLILQAQQGIWLGRSRETRNCVVLLKETEQAGPGGRRLSAWLELLDRLASLRGRRLLNPGRGLAEHVLDTRLEKTLAWIDKNAGTDISQAEAARKISMSPQAFSRYFRHRTGKVFHRYVNEVRIARSCCELLQANGTVGEIAFRSGFNNLANFNRRFREITGHTPRSYRQIEGGLT